MTSDLDKKADELEKKLEELKKSDKKAQNQDKIMGERAFAEIVGGMLFGLFFGILLDRHFNTSPIFLLIMIILGLAGSVYNIYKATK